MPPLHITSLAAGFLAIIFAALTFRVVGARGKSGASLGDGGGALIKAGEEHTVPLLVAVRSHANFCEFVPLGLILIGLCEHEAAPHWIVVTLAVLLVLGRILHPIGMGQKIPNPYRAAGAACSLLVILGGGITLLLRAFLIGA